MLSIVNDSMNLCKIINITLAILNINKQHMRVPSNKTKTKPLHPTSQQERFKNSYRYIYFVYFLNLFILLYFYKT